MQLSEFLKTANSTRMTQHTKDAARLVLVDGMRCIDAAKQMDMKRQQVEAAVARIEAAYKAAQGIPEEWECITVCVPPERVAEVREIERQSMRTAGLSIN
jgi:predicted DNA-binding protein (UPF0251 family)